MLIIERLLHSPPLLPTHTPLTPHSHPTHTPLPHSPFSQTMRSRVASSNSLDTLGLPFGDSAGDSGPWDSLSTDQVLGLIDRLCGDMTQNGEGSQNGKGSLGEGSLGEGSNVDGSLGEGSYVDGSLGEGSTGEGSQHGADALPAELLLPFGGGAGVAAALVRGDPLKGLGMHLPAPRPEHSQEKQPQEQQLAAHAEEALPDEAAAQPADASQTADAARTAVAATATPTIPQSLAPTARSSAPHGAPPLPPGRSPQLQPADKKLAPVPLRRAGVSDDLESLRF